jgi:hypothetical protein
MAAFLPQCKIIEMHNCEFVGLNIVSKDGAATIVANQTLQCKTMQVLQNNIVNNKEIVRQSQLQSK